MRGFFEIGIVHGKSAHNIGTLWRSAYQLGAVGIFTIGARYAAQSSDTCKAWLRIPLRNYTDFEDFNAHRPYGVPLVGIEMGGTPLASFAHPERAIYLLGAEDHGLPSAWQARCQHIVSIEAVREASYNVAVAGSLVLWHRLIQCRKEEGNA